MFEHFLQWKTASASLNNREISSSAGAASYPLILLSNYFSFLSPKFVTYRIEGLSNTRDITKPKPIGLKAPPSLWLHGRF